MDCLTCVESFTSEFDVPTTLCDHITKWLQNEKNNCSQSVKSCTYDQVIKTFFSGFEQKSKKFEKGRTEKDKIDQAIENNPKAGNGRSLLHWAAGNGHKDFFKMILDKAMDKNPGDHKGWTPLHEAVENQHVDICIMILDRLGYINPKDHEGWTPLHVAAENGYEKICKMILDKTSDKNPGDINGWTPLHEAVENGHVDICAMILDIAKETNPKDNEGWTPLHGAAETGHKEIFKMIFDKTKNKNPEDQFGWTPLHEANQNYTQICEMILDREHNFSKFGPKTFLQSHEKNPGDEDGYKEICSLVIADGYKKPENLERYLKFIRHG